MSNGTHEVYVCKHNDVIVYIGKGTKGRHKHCVSGCSHVFELNKIFFTEGVDSLDVSVVKELSSNQEAVELEKYLIGLYQPKFNKVFTNKNTRGIYALDGQTVRTKLKGGATKYKLYNAKKESYYNLVDEFLEYFGYKAILDNSIRLNSTSTYIKIKKKYLTSLVRRLRYDGIENNCQSNIYAVLYHTMLEEFDVDLQHCFIADFKRSKERVN